MTTTRVVDADGLGAKTRHLDVRSSASVEVEAIRARCAEQVNDELELAQVAERVVHRSYARQGVEMGVGKAACRGGDCPYVLKAGVSETITIKHNCVTNV